MSTLPPARTYNQNHIHRKYTPSKRRLSIYWTWSYPWEANRDVTELDNRFSTMTEVRRVVRGNAADVQRDGAGDRAERDDRASARVVQTEH